MNKVYYLIITGILSLGFFQNLIIEHYVSADTLVIVVLLWILLGLFLSIKKEDNTLDTFSNRKWVYMIFILFFLNTIYPFLEYNQSVINTMVAQRYNFAILFFLVLLRLQPSEDELFKAFRVISILSVAVFILALFFPLLFMDEEGIRRIMVRQAKGSTDLINFIPPGFMFAVFFTFMLIQRMVEKATLKNILWALAFILYIIVVQNRSTILGLIPFVIYAIYKIRIRGKWITIAMISVAVGGYLSLIFSSLWDESVEQLSSNKYNRWQAVEFFLFEWKSNLYTVLFGHGVSAKGSDYLTILLTAQKSRLVFISDLGLLGTYFFYGITMLLVIYRFVLKALLSKTFPVSVKFFALWILLVPTIHPFGLMSVAEMIKFSLFFYLVVLYSDKRVSDANSYC